MNLIINGFHEKSLFPIVSKILNKFDVKNVHLTYVRSRLKNRNNRHMVFHNVKDLSIGKYLFNWEKITPLEENLLKNMNDCEVQALKMMDRLNYYLKPSLTYEYRKRLYLKHLRYWNYIIENEKIDLFISSSLPHEVYDYIIYCLCKLKNIPTLFLHQTNICDTVTVMKDLDFKSKKINNNYKKLLKKYAFSNEAEISLTGRLQRDFESNLLKDTVRFEMLRDKPSANIIKNIKPLIMSINIKRVVFLLLRPHLLIQSLIQNLQYIVLIRDGKIKEQFYKSKTIEPDFNQKYIYFPLHLQPEASTSPMAGVFVDQILIAQMIAYYLPKNIYIYIKENPHQDIIRRDVEFYKELLEIPQVRFIPKTYNSYDLTKNSLAVATATGTVGLEALYRRKPVLMFGNNYYENAKGVFQIKNNLECKRALNTILNDKYVPRIKDFKIFLKSLEDMTAEGYIDIDYRKNTRIDRKTNNINIFNMITREIESLKI